MVDYSGQILNERYLVEKLIGKGGMGAVYSGRHMLIGRKVAVKFLHAQYVTHESTVARFYREAKAATAIGHKNIIDILDVGVSDSDDPYLVMEYLEGESLDATMNRKGPMSLEAACSILEPVLQALIAAHKKKIVHRDLKPDNIFLVEAKDDEPAMVKLIDFGISKFLNPEDNVHLTETGALIGTPAYMAPEQIKDPGGVDHRVDIYSLGVILYRMLTGEWPYDAESRNELIVKILNESPRPLLDLKPELPRIAAVIVGRAMSQDLTARYATAAEMLVDIRGVSDPEVRTSELTHLTSTIRERGCAMGNLGDQVPSDGSIPKKILSAVAQQASSQSGAPSPGQSVGERSEQMAPPSSDVVIPGASKRRSMILGATLLMFAFVGFGTYLVFGSSEASHGPVVPGPPLGANTSHRPAAESKSPAPSVSAAENDNEPQQVEIELLNIPETAAIYWNGQRIRRNPFRIPAGETPAKLRIEASGYVTFNAEVTPSANRLVEVHLIETAVEDQGRRERRKGRKRSEKSASEPPSSANNEPSDDNAVPGSTIKFKQGKKGTQIVETFQ